MNIPYKFAIGFQEGTCPLSCNKCAAFGKFAKRRKEVGKMKLDVAKNLIDEIALIGGNYIQPSIYTEPFANHDLKEIIKYCNQKSIGMSIITNGILIDEEWESFILEHMSNNYTISFSLDAVTQDTYTKVRGTGDSERSYDLEKIEKTIKSLINKRVGKFPRIGVNFVLEEDNEEEVELFFNKWKDIADAIRINICVDTSRKLPEKFKREQTLEEYKHCNYPFNVMTIDYNGDVRVCQSDAFGDSYLGNVFTEGILNVWNGQKMNDLRKRHKENKLEETEFCYGCDFGKEILEEVEETEEFFIKKGAYMSFYNRKDRCYPKE